MIRGKNIVYIAVALVTMATTACKNTSPSTNPVPPVVCTQTINGCENLGDRGFSGGASTVLNVVNPTTLNQYAGANVVPTSTVMINLNVAPINGNNFLGQLNIQYYVGSITHAGHFTNGTSTDHGNNVNMLTVDSNNGFPTYRFFFEDLAGMIIVTMTSGSYGSDTGLGTLNGSVYFRNFNTAGPNPLYADYFDPYFGTYFQHKDYNFCWSGLLTQGPYDCRNMSVPPSTSGNYAVTLLGTFTGLDKKTALGL